MYSDIKTGEEVIKYTESCPKSSFMTTKIQWENLAEKTKNKQKKTLWMKIPI